MPQRKLVEPVRQTRPGQIACDSLAEIATEKVSLVGCGRGKCVPDETEVCLVGGYDTMV